jgi:AcrR family transcriptional regulator
MLTVMSGRTVDWQTPAEGLRERKKREMRRQLSSTATEMFLERGFDAVRVAEIAAACGVSEKTVFNYFPTKESLLLDRFDATMSTVGPALSEPGTAVVAATVQVLEAELDDLTSWWRGQPDPVTAGRELRRFRALIRSTASLRTHQRDMQDRLIATAAAALAIRLQVSAEDPRPRIAAIALLGLWQIQAEALARGLDGHQSPDQLRDSVNAEVRHAAETLQAGLGAL